MVVLFQLVKAVVTGEAAETRGNEKLDLTG
jgi:hypothetical protein